MELTTRNPEYDVIRYTSLKSKQPDYKEGEEKQEKETREIAIITKANQVF